jgi:hypothetical protein
LRVQFQSSANHLFVLRFLLLLLLLILSLFSRCFLCAFAVFRFSCLHFHPLHFCCLAEINRHHSYRFRVLHCWYRHDLRSVPSLCRYDSFVCCSFLFFSYRVLVFLGTGTSFNVGFRSHTQVTCEVRSTSPCGRALLSHPASSLPLSPSSVLRFGPGL